MQVIDFSYILARLDNIVELVPRGKTSELSARNMGKIANILPEKLAMIGKG